MVFLQTQIQTGPTTDTEAESSGPALTVLCILNNHRTQHQN